MEELTILNKLQVNQAFALSCLLTLHESLGFKEQDRNLLVLARTLKNTGKVTSRQVRLIQRKLRMYAKILTYLDIQPHNITAGEEQAQGNKILRFHNFKWMVVEFPYDDEEILKVIRTKIYNRKYDKHVPGRWTAPITHDNIEKLKGIGFKLDKQVQEVWASFYPQPASLKKTWQVYDYQHEGVEFLVGANGRGLIADEMGLGKTIQGLYWVHHAQPKKILIIMPKSAKLNWARECQKWIPEKTVQIIDSRSLTKIKGDIVLIHFDIVFITGTKKGKNKSKKFGYPREDLMQAGFDGCIIDEVQNIKNNKTRRTEAIKALVAPLPYLIGLSGTPIKNRPIEFFTFLNMLNKQKWDNMFSYAHKFCGAKHNGFQWEFKGASNLDQLHKKLRGTMIRRLKSETLKDLPSKTRSVFPLNISKTKMTEYRKFETQIRRQLQKEDNRARQLKIIEQLKQKTIDIKLSYCIEWIEEYLEIFPKLVVFAHHKEVLTLLQTHFESRCVRIDGSTSLKERQKNIDLFQNDKNIEVFLGGILAVKEAITLTAAKATVTLQFVWSPTDHLQAEDRVHRIGQKHPVHAYYPVLPQSIDIDIAEHLDQKLKNLSQILDGKPAESDDLFLTILNKYKQNPKI